MLAMTIQPQRGSTKHMDQEIRNSYRTVVDYAKEYRAELEEVQDMDGAEV